MNDVQQIRRAKAAYFFFFAAAAALIPYLTLYYQEVGLSGRQIGFLTGLVPMITLFSASIWGALADASQKHRTLLLVAIGGTWLAILALSQASTFSLFVPIVATYAFFVAPVMPLIDNTVMDILTGRRHEYGKLRIWGAVGWGLLATTSGIVSEQIGLEWAFYGYLLFLFGLWLVSSRLPVTGASSPGQFWSSLRLLVADRRWLLFLFIVLIQGMGQSIFLNFLFLHMADLGASRTLMGLSLTFATISELPFWFFADRLLRRWGTEKTLLFSLFMFAFRGFAYAFMREPWIVLPVSLLHGPSFSAMWAAGVAHAADSAPPGMGATTQGLFSSVVFGLGGTLGGFVGGLMYDDLGASTTFLSVSIGLLVGAACFSIFSGLESGSIHNPFRRRGV